MEDDQPTTPQPETTGPWRARGKLAWRWITRLTGVVCVVLVAAVLFMQTATFRGLVVKHVPPLVNGALVGRVSVDGIEGNVLTRTKLKGVSVYDKRDRLVARVEAIEARYKPWWVLTRHVEVTSVKLQRPLAIVRAYDDGVLNVTLIAKPDDTPKEPGAAWSASVGTIEIEDAHLLYVDERAARGTLPREVTAPADPQTKPPEPPIPGTPPPATLDPAEARFAQLRALLDRADLASIKHDEVALQWGALIGLPVNRLAQTPAPAVVGAVKLSLRASASLQKDGSALATLETLRAEGMANTWTEAIPLKLKDLRALYGGDVVRLTLADATLGDDSHVKDLFAGALFAKALDQLKPGELPRPDDAVVRAPDVQISRGLLERVAGAIPVKSGVRAKVSAHADPEQVGAAATVRFTSAPGEIKLWGKALGWADAILANPERPDLNAIRYDAVARVDGFEPDAVYPIGAQALVNLKAHAFGKGASPDRADAQAIVEVYDSTAQGFKLERLWSHAEVKQSVARLTSAIVRTPYVDARASGSASLRGAFEVDGEVFTTARHAPDLKVSDTLSVRKQYARASLNAKGRISRRHIDDPQRLLRALEARATWDVKDFQAEGYSLKSSDGEVHAELVSNGPDARELSYDATVHADTLRSPQGDLDHVDVEAQGRTDTTLPVSMPVTLAQRLRSSTEVTLRGVRAQGAQLKQGRVSLQTGPRAESAEAIGYAVVGEVEQVRARQGRSTVALRRADLDLTGTLEASLEDVLADPLRALREATASGEVTVQGARADANTVGRAKITLDMQLQAPASGSGTVQVDAWNLRAAGEKIKALALKARVFDERSMDLQVQATREQAPKTIEALLLASANQSLDTLAIDFFGVNLPERMCWVMPRATMALLPGKYKFEEVRLIRMERPEKTKPCWQRPDGQHPLVVVSPTQARRFGAKAAVPFSLISPADIKPTDSDQHLNVRGLVNTRGKSSLTAEVRALDLGALRDGVGLESIPEVKGELRQLKLSLKGDAKTPEVAVKIDLRDFEVGPSGKITLKLDGGYQDEEFSLKTVNLDRNGLDILDGEAFVPIKLSVGGTPKVYWDKEIKAELKIHPIVLSDYKAELPLLADEDLKLNGSLSGMLKIKNKLRDPHLDITLSGENLGLVGELMGTRFDMERVSANIQARYRPLPRKVKGASQRVSPSNAPGRDEGAVGLTASAAVSWKDKEVLFFGANMPMPVSEWIYSVVERGQLPDIEQETLRQPFHVQANVDLDLKTLPISALRDKPYSAEGIVDLDFDLSNTLLDPRMSLKARVGDRVEDPATGGSKTTSGGLGWKQFRDIVLEVDARINRRKLVLSKLLLNWDNLDIMTANGTLELPIDKLVTHARSGAPMSAFRTDLPLDFHVVFKDMPVKKLGAADYRLGKLKGTALGYLDINGKLSAPDITGRIGLFDTEFAPGKKGTIGAQLRARDNLVTFDVEICRDRTVALVLDAKARANLDLLALVEGANPLELTPDKRKRFVDPRGERFAVLEPPDDFLVAIKTRKDRPIKLEEFVPTQFREVTEIAKDVKGELSIDMLVRGTPKRPIPFGYMKLEKTSLTASMFGRQFHDISMNVEMDRKKIMIKQMLLKEGDTSVSMDGTIEHRFLRPTNIDLIARSDTFNFGGFVNQPAFVTSKVTIDAEVQNDMLFGTIRIGDFDARLVDDRSAKYHPTELDGDIVVIDKPLSDKKRPELAELNTEAIKQLAMASKLNANMRVVFAPDSWGRTPFGDVNFKGDVGVDYQGGRLSMSGNVSTIRGSVEFVGKRFDIAKGIVTFTGASPPNPQLQAEAVYELDRSVTASIGEPRTGKPRVIIRVTGTPTQPELRLLSDPSMTSTEILYVLATGRPPGNAEVGEDAGVVNAALSAASGLFLGLLQQELAGKVPVDVLRLEAGKEGLSDSSIEIGKYITQDIFISYRRKFGAGEDPNENIFELEYHFLPRWMLEAKYSDANQGELNVFWDVY